MSLVLAVLNAVLLTVPSLQARGVATQADACRFVRLDARGGSMQHVPVRTQGALGVAYAETAAQMTDAWRFSHEIPGTQNTTSSVAIALAYGDQFKRERLGSGTACPTTAALSLASHCAQFKPVESALAKVGLRNFLRQLDSYFTTYRYDTRKEERLAQLSRKRHPAQTKKFDPKHEARLTSASREILSFLYKSGFTKTMVPSTTEVKALLAQPESKAYFEALLRHAAATCAPKAGAPEPPPARCKFAAASTQATDKEALANEIRRRLSEPNAQPIGIAYCGQVLRKGQYYRGLASKKSRCYKKDDHLSLVIGMRPGFSMGSCQLLVRNSHGTKCEGYSRDWECDKGNIWVDSRALTENTKAISTLEVAND